MTTIASGEGPSPRRVLVVDDDELALRSMRHTLERRGWTVDTATSGPDALERLAAHGAHVVVVDYRMPGMSGIELLHRIKEEYPAARRIITTGYWDQLEIWEAVNRCEVFRFLPKPCSPPQLQAAVAAAFQQREAEENTRRHLETVLGQNEQLGVLARSLSSLVDERTAAMTRGKQEWECTFDAIERPIAVITRDHKVVRANVAYAQMAKKDVRQIPGGICHALLFNRDRPCRGCPVGTGEDSAAKALELTSGDRAFSASFFSSDTNGRFVCVYRETTEEQNLVHRLIQTERLAAVGQLAGGVAHEINNPLGAILAFAQLMQRDDGRSEADLEILRDIEHASLRCKRIVDGLLGFSRRDRSSTATFSVNRAVDDAVVLFQGQLKKRARASFKSELSEDLPAVKGDPGQIEQIVLNLLVNALQSLKNGEGEVRLATRAHGGRLEVVVSDTGVGIPPEDLPRIFEPWFTTKPPGEGTGLGLAVAMSIAQAHGGGIEVQSTVGQGTTFSLWLPPAP